MFDSTLRPDDADRLTRLHGVLDELNTQELTGHTDGELLALWRALEAVRRRLAPIDHQIVHEVQARHLDFVTGAKSVRVLARDVLRIGVGEAGARIRASEALASRRTLTGEVLAPIYARVAAAQAAGSVAEVAARVIIGTIERLPDAVRCEQDDAVEQFLTEQATILDLDGLRQVARRLEATLDPDGLLKDSDYRRRQRDFRLCVRTDGSARFEGEATAELVERFRTVLAPFTKAKPEISIVDEDGGVTTVKDTRTAGQRRHDGLLEALKLVARAELVPDCGGITTTVLLTMSAEDFTKAEGVASTGHGITVAVPEALKWCGGDTIVFPVEQEKNGQLTRIGTGKRLFSKRQRLALIARDHGCTFPGCDAPPQFTEAHHITEHQTGGPTSTDNGTLLCGFHHREFERMGWTVRMTNGLPEWLPPVWLDPAQRPRRNQRLKPKQPFIS